MRYYPVFLDVKGKDCLVVGGGPVGVRKAMTLAGCGASVTVVSERFSRIQCLHAAGIRTEQRRFDPADIQGRFLVFAATDDSRLNRLIKARASACNILCNVADGPSDSDFIVPSTVQRGELTVAVSTSGASPAMARKVRRDLETLFGPEYEQTLILMGNIRKKLLAAGHAPEDHRRDLNRLIDRGILDLIRKKDRAAVDAVLREIFGMGYRYQDLVAVKE